MNEETLFYEGSGEDSGSFYIQPSPMRMTQTYVLDDAH